MDDPLVNLYSKRETTVITTDGRELTLPGSYIMSSCVEQYSRGVAKGCVSNQITMIQGTYYVNTTTRDVAVDPRFDGAYTIASLQSKDKAGVLRGTNYVVTLPEEETKQNIENIKTFFKSGCRNDYMYIPLRLMPLIFANVPRQVRNSISGHANGILIRRSKGTVMRLEPDNTTSLLGGDEAIKSGITEFASEIGLVNPTFVDIEMMCPQMLTRDKNCAFWTMYMFKEILQNIFKKDPNEVIKEMTSKIDQLPTMIENFKKELTTTIIPSQLSALGIKSWPDFETSFRRGGKNGKRKSKFRRTRRKQNGFSIRKTGKARSGN